MRASPDAPSSLLLRTSSSRPCSGTRDFCFAMAKEASPARPARRSQLVQSGRAAEVVGLCCSVTNAAVNATAGVPAGVSKPSASRKLETRTSGQQHNLAVAVAPFQLAVGVANLL